MAKIPKAAIDRLKRIHYLHNTAKNPYKKSQGMFAMDVEPAGQYFTPLDEPPSNIPERFIGGTKEFKNPLVVPEGGAYDDPTNWKRELSKRYGGKTGKALTNAIRKDGYDAIITQGKYGPGEAVDLYKGKGGVDMPSALIPAAGAAALMAPTDRAQAGMINPYSPTQLGTALLQRGGPVMRQEAIPAKFPALHRIANLIGGIQDPTGLALDTSGTADYLRNFGEGNPSFLRALGAMPF